MNKAALKLAWFRMWNTAAIAPKEVPVPSRKVISPRCDTVENASSALRSFLKIAISAPSTIVINPAEQTSTIQISVPDSTGHMRAIRNSPAFTIVAECR